MQRICLPSLQKFMKGFDYSTLYKFMDFYYKFPNIFQALSRKSNDVILDSLSPKSATAISRAVSEKSSPLLTWTHYRTLLQVNDANAREWYAQEAATETFLRSIITGY
jgi:hypothetical protein